MGHVSPGSSSAAHMLLRTCGRLQDVLTSDGSPVDVDKTSVLSELVPVGGFDRRGSPSPTEWGTFLSPGISDQSSRDGVRRRPHPSLQDDADTASTPASPGVVSVPRDEGE